MRRHYNHGALMDITFKKMKTKNTMKMIVKIYKQSSEIYKVKFK